MTKYDDDDPFAIDGAPGPGGRVTGALLMLLGGAIFLTALGVMFYETEMGFGHGLRAFQKTFALVLLFGLPVFIGGIWVYKWGKRMWKGRA